MLLTRFKNKVWNYIENFFYYQRLISPPVIQNINYCLIPNQKKAIICYGITFPFVNMDSNYRSRTQPYEILSMVKVFSELGYCIDIIRCNDAKSIEYIRIKNYDLIFGFGEAFYRLTQLQPKAISILYMTEHHPKFSYREEKKRLRYFFDRHRKRAKISRSGNFYKLSHLDKIYSHVITMSEISAFVREYKKPYSIFPTGLINPNYIYKNKNHQSSKRTFFGWALRAQYIRGLDLLIDVFGKRNDIILHICGLLKQDKKILKPFHRENIIDYGHIDIKSKLFLDVIETCSYLIYPSCSEGFATAVTTAMLHGLIPVVMRDTGFNRLGSNAIFLDDYKIEYLDCRLTELANDSTTKLELARKEVFDFARQNFSVSCFEQSFRTIIVDIVN